MRSAEGSDIMPIMPAKQVLAKINGIRQVKPDVFLATLSAPYLAKAGKPGQFLHIKIKDTILRRPISIHSVKGGTVYILFRVRGRGTRILSRYKVGQTLDIIGPLGNGFSIRPETRPACRQAGTKRLETNILIGGGVGVAPLVFLGEKLRETRSSKSEIRNIVILGAKTKKEILAEQEFKKLGFVVLIATEDGSCGTRGTVVDVLRGLLVSGPRSLAADVYACGPEPMFKAIHALIKHKPNIHCQVSFEQFMGCGLGICCGCTIVTKKGYKKACKDGPVFDIKDIF